MRNRILSVVVGALMVMGMTSVAGAHHRPGHEANYFGLCTAYFSGSEQGQEKKQENGQAFVVFRETIGDYNEDGEENNQDVRDFCEDVSHPGDTGGNEGGGSQNGKGSAGD